MIYFLRKITITIRTYSKRTGQQHLHVQFMLSFYAIKKDQQKVFFYLEVWKIDSVFLYQVYLLNYQNCVYIGMYLRGSCMAVKRLNMILNSCRESFSKTV